MERTSTLTPSLRQATLDDLPAILEIERKLHVAPWTEEHFRSEFEKPYSQTWVMTDDETDSIVLGYIVFWILFEDAQILNVVVDLPYRGMGHAQQMIRKVIGLAMKKEAKRVSLDVRKGNLPAVQLYQKVGFTITQLRKSFYSNGEDAYQMSLSLQEDGVRF